MSIDLDQAAIDEFVAKSRALNGREILARRPWNTTVSPDAIRHFAYGTSDDNPLWLDSEYAARSRYGRLVAPAAFLTSVLYPLLPGAQMETPLSTLIAELQYEWFEPLYEGDHLRASIKQTDVSESNDRTGRRLVLIRSETTYWNQREAIVGKAVGTMARRPQNGTELALDREIYRYSEDELREIQEALKAESRTGARCLTGDEVRIGQDLPAMVRGPLTVGDMVCWQAAVGPSYRAGALGYLDSLEAPHTTVKNPVTGWPVRYSQQHEDFLLASQRGMPAPFDNGVMRFAWVTPLLTNWMGDQGFLRRLSVQIAAPNIYGDTTWYRGRVTGKSDNETGTVAAVQVTGTNQLGVTTTTGVAEVQLASGAVTRRRHRADRGQKADALRQAVSGNGQSRPRYGSIHELFESQVEQRPNDKAVVDAERAWSYRELNQRANRLAHHLRSLGVRPEMRVGICLERSAETVVAVLAVLKAGGAYVPLDPEYPEERLTRMLQDADVKVVLTQLRLRPSFSGHGVVLVRVDDGDERKRIESNSNENCDASATAENLAYVMHTSGSGSTPKAVAVPHGSLRRYVDAIKGPLGIGDDDIYLHTASFSFSASVRQLMLPLCAGATVVVAGVQQKRDPIALFELIRARDVTVWDTVPSFWRASIDTLTRLPKEHQEEVLRNRLRLILVTGEALPWELPDSWMHSLKHEARIVNLYSQTETAGTVSYYPVPRDCAGRPGTVPLGKPVDHTQLYIVDEQLQLVAAGEIGEICVGGERLARGYLGRPELTAERFVRDRFREERGARLCRTGDLGRRLPDGNVQFAGRRDEQIKLRGFRVGLSEIEAALTRHPKVREAAVAPLHGPGGPTELAAYVVPRPSSAPSVHGFQRYKLPNNLAVAHLNRHETEYTYGAVFEQQTYLRHGITFLDGDCIFDVGANIGLFALFAHCICRDPKVYCFEPNPRVFEILKANASLYAPDLRLNGFGLSRAEDSARFTSFPGFSLLSGFRADVEDEKNVVRTYMRNLQAADRPEVDQLLEQLEPILDKRFEPETLTARVRTLSSVMEEEGISSIDLLKINAEKSELDVLRGIWSDDWPKIKQIILKIDELKNLETILPLLEENGYDSVVEQDALFENSELRTVYAVRRSGDRRLLKNEANGAHLQPLTTFDDPLLTIGELRQFVLQELPDFMAPSEFVLLGELPRTPSGKVDRSALPVIDERQAGSSESFVAASDPLEKTVAQIWVEVLGVKQVGTRDDFFELGGHSLRAIQIVARLNAIYPVKMRISDLFETPTVASLAQTLAERLDEEVLARGQAPGVTG